MEVSFSPFSGAFVALSCCQLYDTSHHGAPGARQGRGRTRTKALICQLETNPLPLNNAPPPPPNHPFNWETGFPFVIQRRSEVGLSL